jgi:iron complex outermembrane receptor protein
MKTRIRLLVLTLLAGGLAVEAAAQAKKPAADLARVSIEDLMNMEITSASRKEQRLGEIAAAVYVITQDDIRRSGMTTVPDLLRLVPGVQVAQVSGGKWAVSVRGFNQVYSNKLLVLVDGRSVYNRMFSGVLWDAEDLALDDIDRIEVIRGPGGAAWGANAVNGVINIVTRAAADTSGALVRLGGGTSGAAQAVARYGGSAGGVAYRVYSQWTTPGETLLAPQVGAGDNLRRATVGFRSDWTGGVRTLTVEGRATRGGAKALWINFDPTLAPDRLHVIDTASEMNGGMVRARWTDKRESGATLQIQTAFDVDHRDEPVGDYRRRMGDVDLQYHTAVGARHDLVAGAGYRVNYERFDGLNGYSLTPVASTAKVFNVFAQDEVALVGDRLHVTLGARVERDDLAGWGLLPTAAVRWALVPERQYLWAKTSRALRTPSLADRGIRLDLPPLPDPGPLPIRPSTFGNPEARAEEFVDAEAGYRAEIGSVAAVAVTGFFGRYEHLSSQEPQSPVVVMGPTGPYVSVPVTFRNLRAANTTGLEIDGQWAPAPWWRLGAGYSAFRLRSRLDAASHDPNGAQYDGDAPGHQWHVRSSLSLGRAEVDTTVSHVGALGRLGVKAYTRADARFEWKVTGSLSAAVIGQNLVEPAHAEFSGDRSWVTTTVPRSVRLQLTWRVAGR